MRGFSIGPLKWSAGHRGVDLASAPGMVIRAPAAGTITFAGVVAGRPVLSIDHGDGLVSSVEPVLATVHPGDQVRAGDPIGTLWPGPGHCSPGYCLHWGVRRDGQYIDPASLVAGAWPVIVLLPGSS